LQRIKKNNVKNVLVHDAARPNFSLKLLNQLIKELKKNKSVIPTINPKDTV